METAGGVVSDEESAGGGNEGRVYECTNAVGTVVKRVEGTEFENGAVKRPVLDHEMAEAEPGGVFEWDGSFEERGGGTGGCERDLVMGGVEGEGEGGGFGIGECMGGRGRGDGGNSSGET